MPGSLFYKKQDPNRKGRGVGVYYHRGKGVWSKYSIARDKAKRSRGWKQHIIGLPKGTKIPHTSDGRLPR